jgi:hypothetical protein
VTGLHFSANSPQLPYLAGPLRFGSSEDRDDNIPKGGKSEEDAFVPSDAGKRPDSAEKLPQEDRLEPNAPREAKRSDGAGTAETAEPVRKIDAFQRDEQSQPKPVKNKMYWFKSVLLSAISMAALGAMVIAMIPGIGIGMIPALGLILAGLLVHDISTNISRQKGLANISDLDYLRSVLLERTQRPLEIASHVFHPISAEKRALFVEKHLHKVRTIDPHKLLNKTGMDYQTMLNDLKSETAVAAKALIIGRFMALFLIKRGLGGLLMGRSKILAWIAMGLWALISQNKHGSLQDQPLGPVANRPRPATAS